MLKCGVRELDLVKNYTGHEYDQVLDLYYAKARFYDASDRRFLSVDPILDTAKHDISTYTANPMQLVQYLYVVDNPLIFVDPLGLCWFDANGNWRHDNWEYTGNYTVKQNPRNMILVKGNSGYAVSELQTLLYRYGYLAASEVNGYFGTATQNAVTEFQRINGLSVSGLVGKTTWDALFSINVKKADYLYGSLIVTNPDNTVSKHIIYVPEMIGGDNSDKVPATYTYFDFFSETFTITNLPAILAGLELEGGDIANTNASITDLGHASLLGFMASVTNSIVSNTMMFTVTATYYSRGSSTKVVVELNTHIEHLAEHAGGYMLLLNCDHLGDAEYALGRKLSDETYLGILPLRLNVQMYVDPRRAENQNFSFYLYVDSQGDWYAAPKKYASETFMIMERKPSAFTWLGIPGELIPYDGELKIDFDPNRLFNAVRVDKPLQEKIEEALKKNSALLKNSNI